MLESFTTLECGSVTWRIQRSDVHDNVVGAEANRFAYIKRRECVGSFLHAKDPQDEHPQGTITISTTPITIPHTH
jgi:hypothetical protein